MSQVKGTEVWGHDPTIIVIKGKAKFSCRCGVQGTKTTMEDAKQQMEAHRATYLRVDKRKYERRT